MKVRLRELLISGGADETAIRHIESAWYQMDNMPHSNSWLTDKVEECGQNSASLTAFFKSTYLLNQKCSADLARMFANRVGRYTARQRQINLGITLAIWRYQPYGLYGCEDHFSLDGRWFSLQKGIKFNGKSIFPGESADCACFSRPIIPGIIDDCSKESIINRIKRFFGY